MIGAMGQTIAIALAATLLTLVFSLVIGSLAARNVAPSRTVHASMRLLLVIIRGIPEIILAIVLIVITGLGMQAGTIALAFAASVARKARADSFEEVKAGPERALIATGASRTQVYASATLPQGMKALIAHGFYMLDTNVRAATILGLVGGGGVGYYLLNAGQGSKYDLVMAIVLMILVTVLSVEGLAIWMRRVFVECRSEPRRTERRRTEPRRTEPRRRKLRRGDRRLRHRRSRPCARGESPWPARDRF